MDKGWKLIDIGKTRRRIAATNVIVKRKDICEAMLKAGIDDPESLKGKRFCTDKCPYDRCIVVENRERKNITRRKERDKDIWGYHIKGLKHREIADILRVSCRTVGRSIKSHNFVVEG